MFCSGNGSRAIVTASTATALAVFSSVASSGLSSSRIVIVLVKGLPSGATRSAQRNVDVLRAFDQAVVDDRHAEILDGLAGGELKRAGRGEIVGGGLGGAVTRRVVDRQRIQDTADARDRDGSAARVFIDDVVRRKYLRAP